MKKIIASLVLAIMALFSFGCTDKLPEEETYIAPYNAILYDNCGLWINDDFKAENRVKGAIYNDEFEWGDYPKSRTFIITDSDSFKNAIIDNFKQFEVDFDKEMIILYTFVADCVLPAKINKMELVDEFLSIHCVIELIRNSLTTCQPFQRWLIVKLDKLSVTAVENTISYEYED